jgi:hypothetical protein
MSYGLATLTIAHVIISLVGIGTGFVVIFGLLTAKRLDSWTAVFLATTVLTSVTAFLFPIEQFTPGLALAILSLLVLGPAILARYVHHLSGTWRTTYVVCAVIAQYFNVFVLIAQLFQKVPFLEALAPTQSAPVFLITQGVVLALFVVLTIAAVIRFRIESSPQRTDRTSTAVL